MTARSTGLLVLAFLLMGCGSFDRDAPAKRRYMLEVERPAQQPGGGGHQLEVRAFQVASPYALTSFVYRTKEGAFDSDFYNEFFVDPGDILAGACRDWMLRSGLFASVQAGGSQIAPTHVIEGDVLELYGDYRNEGLAAVISIRVVLLDATTDALIFQKVYTLRETLTDTQPSSLVEGWNRALASLLERVESDVRDALAGG